MRVEAKQLAEVLDTCNTLNTDVRSIAFIVAGLFAQHEDGDYPLLQAGFERRYTLFLDALVGSCSKRILYDANFTTTLLAYFAELVQSPIRSFRHTITLTGQHRVSTRVAHVPPQRCSWARR